MRRGSAINWLPLVLSLLLAFAFISHRSNDTNDGHHHYLTTHRDHSHDDDHQEDGSSALWLRRRELQTVETAAAPTTTTTTTDTCTKECCESICNASPLDGFPVWLSVILVVFLLVLSAMFSGLTLGVLGLDLTGLEIVKESGDANNAKYAERIYPIRKNGNQLLCTLTLGSTCVNALVAILMAVRTISCVLACVRFLTSRSPSLVRAFASSYFSLGIHGRDHWFGHVYHFHLNIG
jgi:hypothetical protein